MRAECGTDSGLLGPEFVTPLGLGPLGGGTGETCMVEGASAPLPHV